VKRILFITPTDASHGFSLAGVRQLVLAQDQLRNVLRALSDDPAIGVVVIDERLIGGPDHELLRDTDPGWPGLVVVLPAPTRAPRPEEDYAQRLIRRAVGYQVRVSL
jgi:V/A-type H+/Na+-transporting ATPase subunit F